MSEPVGHFHGVSGDPRIRAFKTRANVKALAMPVSRSIRPIGIEEFAIDHALPASFTPKRCRAVNPSGAHTRNRKDETGRREVVIPAFPSHSKSTPGAAFDTR
jgi:hypothetical protein